MFFPQKCSGPLVNTLKMNLIALPNRTFQEKLSPFSRWIQKHSSSVCESANYSHESSSGNTGKMSYQYGHQHSTTLTEVHKHTSCHLHESRNIWEHEIIKKAQLAP